MYMIHIAVRLSGVRRVMNIKQMSIQMYYRCKFYEISKTYFFVPRKAIRGILTPEILWLYIQPYYDLITFKRINSLSQLTSV